MSQAVDGRRVVRPGPAFVIQQPFNEWSLREKLALASAVEKSGQQNWGAVSRTIKPFAECSRPLDWFSPKNCAIQYNRLLQRMDQNKRKRGEQETVVKALVVKLTNEYTNFLSVELPKGIAKYTKKMQKIKDLEAGNISPEEINLIYEKYIKSRADPVEIFSDDDEYTDVSEEEEHADNTEADKSEPIQEIMDTDEVEILEVIEVLESPPPDMELESPPPDMVFASPMSSSTDGRQKQPKKKDRSRPLALIITNTDEKPTDPGEISPGLSQLVSSAIAGTDEEIKRTNRHPSGSSTLSMLLEMPPRAHGQPLPKIPKSPLKYHHQPSSDGSDSFSSILFTEDDSSDKQSEQLEPVADIVDVAAANPSELEYDVEIPELVPVRIALTPIPVETASSISDEEKVLEPMEMEFIEEKQELSEDVPVCDSGSMEDSIIPEESPHSPSQASEKKEITAVDPFDFNDSEISLLDSTSQDKELKKYSPKHRSQLVIPNEETTCCIPDVSPIVSISSTEEQKPLDKNANEEETEKLELVVTEETEIGAEDPALEAALVAEEIGAEAGKPELVEIEETKLTVDEATEDVKIPEFNTSRNSSQDRSSPQVSSELDPKEIKESDNVNDESRPEEIVDEVAKVEEITLHNFEIPEFTNKEEVREPLENAESKSEDIKSPSEGLQADSDEVFETPCWVPDIPTSEPTLAVCSVEKMDGDLGQQSQDLLVEEKCVARKALGSRHSETSVDTDDKLTTDDDSISNVVPEQRKKRRNRGSRLQALYTEARTFFPSETFEPEKSTTPQSADKKRLTRARKKTEPATEVVAHRPLTPTESSLSPTVSTPSPNIPRILRSHQQKVLPQEIETESPVDKSKVKDGKGDPIDPVKLVEDSDDQLERTKNDILKMEMLGVLDQIFQIKDVEYLHKPLKDSTDDGAVAFIKQDIGLITIKQSVESGAIASHHELIRDLNMMLYNHFIIKLDNQTLLLRLVSEILAITDANQKKVSNDPPMHEDESSTSVVIDISQTPPDPQPPQASGSDSPAADTKSSQLAIDSPGSRKKGLRRYSPAKSEFENLPAPKLRNSRVCSPQTPQPTPNANTTINPPSDAQETPQVPEKRGRGGRIRRVL